MLGRIRRWLSRDDGVVAIEFAMLALPFFALLIGSVEFSLAFAASYMLEGGTVEAARLVRTGEAVDSGDPETAFKDRLCDQVSFLIPCNDIVYESIVLDSFASASDFAPQYDASGNMVSQGFSAGASENVVMVRVFYKYEFMTPFIGNLVTNGGGSSSMNLMSTAVIKNEPYTFGG